eukprot:scaffold3025_cov354-Prasinococcus_capsulatus_cf.AAC.2
MSPSHAQRSGTRKLLHITKSSKGIGGGDGGRGGGDGGWGCGVISDLYACSAIAITRCTTSFGQVEQQAKRGPCGGLRVAAVSASWLGARTAWPPRKRRGPRARSLASAVCCCTIDAPLDSWAAPRGGELPTPTPGPSFWCALSSGRRDTPAQPARDTRCRAARLPHQEPATPRHTHARL